MEEKDEKFEIVMLARGSNKGMPENSLYVDTCASNHMCRKRSMFVELNKLVSSNILFGDDSQIPEKGNVIS